MGMGMEVGYLWFDMLFLDIFWERLGRETWFFLFFWVETGFCLKVKMIKDGVDCRPVCPQ